MKRVLSAILTLVIVCSMMTSIVSANNGGRFWDVDESHWAYNYVETLSENGVISGYPDGSFNPDATVTRAEWAKMLCVAGGLDGNVGNANSYDDVNSDEWYAPYVAALGDNMPTMTAEDGGTYFAPDNQADRQSVTVSLVNLKDYEVETADTSVLYGFEDNEYISEPFSQHVATAVQNGLVNGFEDGTFRPQDTLTRAEAATLLYRAFYYTEVNYEAPAGTPISEAEVEDISLMVQDAFNSVESLHVEELVDMEVNMMGRDSKIGAELKSDAVVDKIIHTMGKSYSDNLTLDMELYVEKNGEMASMYVNVDNTTWMRQDARVIDLKAMQNYEDPYESAQEFIAAFQCAEKSETDYNGKPAVLVTGILDMEDPHGVISATGLNVSGISTSQFVQMLTGVDPIYVSLYLDPSTNLPYEMYVDMKDCMTTLMNNMGKITGQSSMMTFKHVYASFKFSDYNNVNVAVPEEVKAAVMGY